MSVNVRSRRWEAPRGAGKGGMRRDATGCDKMLRYQLTTGDCWIIDVEANDAASALCDRNEDGKRGRSSVEGRVVEMRNATLVTLIRQPPNAGE